MAFQVTSLSEACRCSQISKTNLSKNCFEENSRECTHEIASMWRGAHAECRFFGVPIVILKKWVRRVSSLMWSCMRVSGQRRVCFLLTSSHSVYRESCNILTAVSWCQVLLWALGQTNQTRLPCARHGFKKSVDRALYGLPTLQNMC